MRLVLFVSSLLCKSPSIFASADVFLSPIDRGPMPLTIMTVCTDCTVIARITTGIVNMPPEGNAMSRAISSDTRAVDESHPPSTSRCCPMHVWSAIHKGITF
eukprot:TRINITY_DN28027_c0_g1_i1.p2 TRINITY_DN28027_c0_g1~~TRINITY_DN28027_c0_g1_i1.p2  ORF type:complete len:102 (+),score=6.32 TRINITY_DN28027_c0_g1_i1:267-572(+)